MAAVKLPNDVALDPPVGGSARRLPDDVRLDEPYREPRTTADRPSFFTGPEDPYKAGTTLPRVSDVVPPVVNFLDYPARAIAADLYSSVDLAKRQFSGEKPTQEDWWRTREKVIGTGEIPETTMGQKISGVLAVPGRIVGAAVKGLSNLTIGPERTRQIAPYAAVATDIGSAALGARALSKERTAPSVSPPQPFTVAQKTFQDVDLQASDVVGKRIAQDVKYGGPTATEAMKKLTEGRKIGKPLTIADVGEENIGALGGYVSRQPGSRSLARSFLEARDKAASERLAQDVGKYVFSGPTMLKTTDDLLKSRSAAARPLYQQAEALQGVWSPRLEEFIADSDVRRGLARGYRLERLDALAEGRKFDPTQLGVDLDFQGNIVMKRVPNMRVLDMGKRGLDAMIADERDSITGRLSALGMELNKVKHSYVDVIDSLDRSGVYRAAREAWAGPSQSLDSMRWGRTIFNRPPEETAREFSKLPPNDQEFARLGVADMLRERIAKTGFSGNEARAVIKNAWTRDQLRPIFRSDDEFEKFSDAVMAEHMMAGTTAKMTRGSQTAERVVEDRSGLTPEVAHSATMMASSVIHGHFPVALIHAWRIQRRLRKDVGVDPALNEAVAKIIFNPDIELTDPRVQRIISGPPKTGDSGTARRIVNELGLYMPPVIGYGISNPQHTK